MFDFLRITDPSAEALAAVFMATATKLAGLSLVAYRHRAKFEKIGTVGSLYIYPVKSCGVLDTDAANITRVGLEKDGVTDRQWAILGPDDQPISMKDVPKLSLVRCSVTPDSLILHAPDMPDLTLPRRPETKGHYISFYKQRIMVIECGTEAEKWITKFLDVPARIVYSSPELGTRDAYTRTRKWDNDAKPGDVAIFAYLTSYLVTTTASLDHINSQIDTPVSMINFRPNIVIDNTVPFDEDNWKGILIGEEALFHYVEPCRRCVITTINPETAIKRKDVQPIKLLRTFRCKDPYGAAPLFGVYFANDSPGPVRVGDPVYVLKA